MSVLRIPEAHWLALSSIIWLLAASLLCLLSVPGPNAAIPHLDKLMHAILYASVTFCWGLWAAPLWPALGVVILFGLHIEFLQAFSGLRAFELLDFLADIVGALLGMIIGRQCRHHGYLKGLSA